MRVRKEIFVLNIDDVLPNRFQPRIKFDEKAILELAESIKKHGVIQPIIVRRIADKYEIIAGERRYKASIIAGRKTIPAILTDVDDKESSEIALIENIQRQDMTPIEEAISYKKILDMGYITQAELAVKLGKTQSTVANKLRLLNLTDEVQEALLEEKISERHARSLLKVPKQQQPEILNKIISERLTVRKTDQLISQIMDKKEEESDTMNNEEINKNFNIPSEPIIDATQEEKPKFNPFGGMVNNNEEPVVQVEQPVNNAVEQNPFEIPAQPQAEQPVNYGVDPNLFEIPPQPLVEQPMNYGVEQNPFEVPAQPQVEQPMNYGVEQNPFEVPAQPQVEQPMNYGVEQNPFEIPAQPQVEQPMNYGVEQNPFEIPAQPQVEQPMNYGVEQNPFEIPAQPQVEQPMNNVVEQNPFEIPAQPQVDNNAAFSPMPNYPYPATEELTPLMPENSENAGPSADLNTVINTMRDCVRQIESFGYKVDSEEADMSNSYEFTIKITKV